MKISTEYKLDAQNQPKRNGRIFLAKNLIPVVLYESMRLSISISDLLPAAYVPPICQVPIKISDVNIDTTA